ncbi:hypothetical protein CLV84_1737 [Neolewinella xylanilytica]|uniref:DUF5723 domain-containing protein n=1 Tax=Neolewinella xylanilytica TaxID=1514080 RepID=A0A2S6IBC5_9BACT|nr:DUF5723 family protein [Neolewinella xylanilytica]PPK88766.1 hypothetical protein CLV84_1737 [Neolewinella xylanilytica]
MKTQYTLPLLLFCILTSANVSSQGYFGLRMDNYAGIHGVTLNPAELANSRVATEINLGSVSTYLSNDYLTVDFSSDLVDDFDGLWEESIIRNPQSDNRLNGNIDIVGPSLMFRAGKKSGIAFSTRLRGLYRIDNFSGQLLEGVQDDFDAFSAFDFAMNNHRSFLHTYLEAGFSYGTVVIEGLQSQLKVGGSVKYLQGVGASFTSSESLTGSYNGDTERIDFNGDFTYGTTTDYYYDEIPFGELTSGFGFDVGVAWEWWSKELPDSPLLPPYRLKLGASITDIGTISYEGADQSSYQVNGTLRSEEVEGEEVEYILDGNFDGTESTQTVEAGLPTSLNLMADFRVAGKLYFSAVMNKSLSSRDELFSSSFPTVVAVTPRLQTKWLGLYAPVVFGGYEGPTVGAGLRFWILTVGSGSLLTDLVLGDNPYSTDVYVGVKLPFYRRTKPNKKDVERMEAEKEEALDTDSSDDKPAAKE